MSEKTQRDMITNLLEINAALQEHKLTVDDQYLLESSVRDIMKIVKKYA